MELFFAADKRIWAASSRELRWCQAPFAYSPGPAALQGLKALPLAVLRRLLLVGLPVEEAVAWGLMHQADAPVLSKAEKMPMSWLYGGGKLKLPEVACRRTELNEGRCSLLGYGLALPGDKFSQEEIAGFLGVNPSNKRDWSILTASHIRTRYLAELKSDLEHPECVGPERLSEKHRQWATTLLKEAIQKAAQDAGICTTEIGHITVASSTGYMLPGLTAYVIQDSDLKIRPSVNRVDIVGMGCHAGMNTMKSAASWAAANPGKYALACAVEVSSAHYVWGQETSKQLNNVIVNSLFGDGCFAAVFQCGGEAPAYLDMPPAWWSQLCDTGALEDMIYKPEMSEHKIRFDLSELAPYHVAQGIFTMMNLALEADIPVHYAKHVITHTGGRTVLDCSAVALGLEGVPSETLPYTVQALEDYGNQSSSSFMFAFHKLVESGRVHCGDLGLFVTMGPGAGLESALWTAGKRFPSDTLSLQVSQPPSPSTTRLPSSSCLTRPPSDSSSTTSSPMSCGSQSVTSGFKSLRTPFETFLNLARPCFPPILLETVLGDLF